MITTVMGIDRDYSMKPTSAIVYIDSNRVTLWDYWQSGTSGQMSTENSFNCSQVFQHSTYECSSYTSHHSNECAFGGARRFRRYAPDGLESTMSLAF